MRIWKKEVECLYLHFLWFEYQKPHIKQYWIWINLMKICPASLIENIIFCAATETINSIVTILAHNCHIDKIDIKGTYCSVPSQKEHQTFKKILER